MRDAQRAAVRQLGHARKRFADYARARFGLPEVDLFSQVEQPKQKWAALAEREWSQRPHSDSTFS
jgi:type II secretory pathway component PulK